MRDPREWTESDLTELIQNDIQENFHLDYKQSRALARTDDCYNELSKDVSAFANSDGGLIVYGIAEKNHHPDRIDEGVNAIALNREWLEQVISSYIQPKIDGLKIYPIGLPSRGADQVAYVIDIPQSTSRAPHQSSRNHKYYKRYNFRSVPMEDYEIRDIMRRATTPDLFINLRFDSGDSTKIVLRLDAKEIDSVALHAEIGNRSNTPAQHAIIDIYLDDLFRLQSAGGLGGRREKVTHDGHDLTAYYMRWSVPHDLPIFAETAQRVGEAPIMFTIPTQNLHDGMDYYIGYAIQSPGCSVQQFVRVIRQGETLWMPKQRND
jgi:hypothetical protein